MIELKELVNQISQQKKNKSFKEIETRKINKHQEKKSERVIIQINQLNIL